ENSIGFHNPTEAMRVLGDSLGFATKGEALLRQALAQAGVNVPLKVDLEIAKYLDNRGEKKIKWDKNVEFKDPFGVQDRF
ncbi:MAG: ammonia-forming cytochrome c nitrite reductase subunit c552, partial [Desulfovibrio sp.]|nr:ammonia-forming cytochrome c nitrite reductase subunit c552 [Desulfovibrio sp.]